MTKDFYEKNYKVLVLIIENCKCEDFRVCSMCPIGDACEYCLTGDDSDFEEEE